MLYDVCILRVLTMLKRELCQELQWRRDMKKTGLILFVVTIIISGFSGVSFADTTVITTGHAPTDSGYESGVEYSVCYGRYQLIKVAYIDGISIIGGKKFLKLTKPDAPESDANMQISMDSVTAIVPAIEARDGQYNFCR
jgi:hypothetical protein